MGASNKGKFPKDMSPIFTKFAAFLKVLQNYTRQNRFQYIADILILLGLVIFCALIFGLLGKVFSTNVFRMSLTEFRAFLVDNSWLEDVRSLKIYNLFSTFGAWVVSGFLLFKIRGYQWSEYWRFKEPEVKKTWVLLPFLFISAIFIASFLLYLNQQISIPENLRSGIGSEESRKLLERMLEMNSTMDLLFNLLIIALAPAIFEEIFFRGTLQPLLIGFARNKHIGIWVGSFLFAAIHLNLQQIIPMFFLALVLGYLCYFTGSLIPGIIIHFCNNGLAVMANYYSKTSPIARKVADDTYVPGIPEIILCTVVLAGIFYYLYQQTKTVNIDE
jgi:membrane protease YdiL (CAAX protease family)